MSFNARIDALLTAIADDDADAVERALQIYDVNDIVAVMAKRLLDAEASGGGGSLPSEWTVGANGELEIQPDADATALTLKADVGQTANQFEVYDDTDTLAVQIEFDGGMANFNAFRIRPLAAFTTGVQMQTDGSITQKTDFDAWTGETSLGATFLRIRAASASNGAILEVQRAQGQVGLLIESQGSVENPGDAVQVVSGLTGNNAFRVLDSGAMVTAQNAEPADGALVAGEMAIWFDATNGAAKVMAKGKTADGTVVTGDLGSLT